MKKIWLVLSIVMAFMLLFACTAEKAISPDPETPTDPPEHGTPPAAEPINWMDNVPDTPYDTFTVSRDIEVWGYTFGTEVGQYKHTDTLAYTFYNKTETDRLHYLLGQPEADELDESRYGFEFSIRFSGADGKNESLKCIYEYSRSTFSWHLGIKDADDNIKWLPDLTERYFREQCKKRGMNDETFFFYRPISYPDCLPVSVQLRDIEKQLTPEEAAQKLVYRAFLPLMDHTPNKISLVTEIGDIPIKMLDTSQPGYYTRDNRWLLRVDDINISFEGLHTGGGVLEVWTLEYESGWWRLYTNR